MAISNPMSVERTGGFLGIGQGTKYNYTPTEYKRSASYDPYSSDLTTQARGVLGQQMTGQLSQSTLDLLKKQMSQNLASTREGAYGMPLGAQKGLEVQQAGANALSAAQLAENQRNWAVTNSLPYEQQAANQKYLGYQSGVAQDTAEQNWNSHQQDLMAQYTSMEKPGMGLGDLIGGALTGGVGKLLGDVVGRGAMAGSNAIFGSELGNTLEEYKKYGFDPTKGVSKKPQDLWSNYWSEKK